MPKIRCHTCWCSAFFGSLLDIDIFTTQQHLYNLFASFLRHYKKRCRFPFPTIDLNRGMAQKGFYHSFVAKISCYV